jgi:hypothetical protein
LICSPPLYPTNELFDPITLWHGTIIGIGFLLFAPPTALHAFSFPMLFAISL